MTADLEDLSNRLAALAEELADVALERLRQASYETDDEGRPDPATLAEERRITRARRAVDKASALLRGGQEETGDPGPY